MKTSSSSFAAAHSSPNKEMRLVVKINYPQPVYFTSHDDVVINDGIVFLSALTRTSSLSAKLNPDDARTEIGSISFQIIDKGGAVTNHFRSELELENGLKGKFVELYSGYAGLPFEDYRLEQTQVIDKSISYDGGSYSVQCRDIQREMRKQIFDPAKTRLAANVSKIADQVTVFDANDFEFNDHGSSYGLHPNTSVLYFKIKYKNGFEICSATGKNGNTFTGVERGLFGTREMLHEVPSNPTPENGPEVIEFVYLELPSPKMIYAALTGKLLGEAGEIPSRWNLGIPETYVDSNDFTNIGTDLYDPNDDSKGFISRFESIEKTDGKMFIETQMCFPRMFLTVKANGKIGLKRMNGVLSNADYIDTLDLSCISKLSDLKQDLSRVHSFLDVKWSWYEFPGKKAAFYRRDSLLDPKSVLVHNNNVIPQPLSVELKGLHNSRHTYTTLKNLFNALRDRYAGPPLHLKLDLLPSKNSLEIGDLVRVKVDQLPDMYSTNSLDRTFEVQRVSVNQLTGKITVDLFGSSEEAGPISDGASYVLPDLWYSSEGTAAGSQLSIDGAGSLTSDGTLTGSANSRTIFYYSGDLTIPAGRVLTTEENVELRVLGHFQCDGDIVTTSSSNSAAFLGTTMGGVGSYVKTQYQSYINPAWQATIINGQHSVCPAIEIENNGGVLVGVPSDMRGSGGGLGGSEVNAAGEVITFGGPGGAGGGSLVVVARGMALGAAGGIILDGESGQAAANSEAGSGGGGAPGVFLFLQDGAQGTTPFFNGKVSAKFGESPSSPSNPGKGSINLRESAARIVFIPQSRSAYPDYEIDETRLNGSEELINQAQSTADAAAQSAADAKDDADSANLEIERMSSDGYLTPVEKKRLIREVEEIHDEESDIVAKANIYGITIEKNNYQQDIIDLDNYLATLDSPVLWSNLSGSTIVPDYAWFKSYFGLVYATRQKLLNKIAEEAGKVADWGGVSGSGRPEDNATVGATDVEARQIANGKTLFYQTFDNQDQIDEWDNYLSSPNPFVGATSNIRRGGGCFVAGDNSGDDQGRYIHPDNIPFDPDTLYSIDFYVRQPQGSGNCYLGVAGVAGDGVTGVRNDGGNSFTGGQHYFSASAVTPPTGGFVKYTGWFKGHSSSGAGGQHSSPSDPGTMHDDVRFFRPLIFCNWGGSTGTFQCDAVVVKAYDARSMNNLTTTVVNPAQLTEQLSIDQGDGTFRRASFGLGAFSVRDGDSVNFPTAFNTPPRIKLLGGLSYSNTLSGKHAQDIKAINITTSGFDVRAKLVELAGSVNSHTDTGGSTNVDGLDYVKHKSQSAQAWDDKYTFQKDVEVINLYDSEMGIYLPGNVTIGIYTNDGSGWVKRAEKSYSGDATATKTYSNDTTTITVDGLTNHAGHEFGIDVISTAHGGSITSFDSVKYETASAPAEESATVSGVSDLYAELLAGE